MEMSLPDSVAIYLVGGAVRDRLLDITVYDRDWLVVGATPENLMQEGYKQVEADFPVFIHPESGEEYALARREIKNAPGYQGFIVESGCDVTIDEDLARRDLTINAMAQDEGGALIDPYNGQDDLQRGLLRHVTEAFVEDPVRVLRIARFAAKFGDMGFHVAHSTHRLMKSMSVQGELEHLKPQRVWQELKKSLSYNQPWRFLEVLNACGALEIVLPRLKALFDVSIGHKEKNQSEQITAVKRASAITENTHIRFAVLLADSFQSSDDVTKFCRALCVERPYADLLRAVVNLRLLYEALEDANSYFRFIHSAGGYKQNAQFDTILQVFRFLYSDDDMIVLLLTIANEGRDVSASDFSGVEGAALGAAIKQKRIELAQHVLATINSNK